MIPYLGAIGATILVFIAFILAVISFTFIIACAWICARPWLSIILFGLIAVMVIVGNNNKDKIPKQTIVGGNGVGIRGNYSGDVVLNRIIQNRFLGN